MQADSGTPSSLWHGSERAARDVERQQRLLGAALELYGTIGYRATTVQAVCRQAKVSTRSFYEIYADQGELLQQLYAELNEELMAGIRHVDFDPELGVFAAVREVVAAALGPMLADARKARVLEVEVVGISAAMELQRRVTNQRLAEAVDAAFAALTACGLIERSPQGLTSVMLIGGITEALVQWVQAEPALRGPAPEFIDELSLVIVRMAGAR